MAKTKKAKKQPTKPEPAPQPRIPRGDQASPAQHMPAHAKEPRPISRNRLGRPIADLGQAHRGPLRHPRWRTRPACPTSWPSRSGPDR